MAGHKKSDAFAPLDFILSLYQLQLTSVEVPDASRREEISVLPVLTLTHPWINLPEIEASKFDEPLLLAVAVPVISPELSTPFIA